MDTNEPTILVTGATGTVGRHVVDQLCTRGHQVRALSRDPETAHLPAGVEVVPGDLMRPDTLTPALDGVTGLHLITFGTDYEPLETGPEIVELAGKAGVRRVTVLGGWEPGSVERALTNGPIGWTLLAPVGFMANTLDLAESIRTDGLVRAFDGGIPGALVHEADIGAVAAIALTEDGHADRTYRLTGPEAITMRQQLDTIGAAIDRDIELVPLTEDEARERMAAEGCSAEYIEFAIELELHPPEIGSMVLSTIQEVTGKPARTFAHWAREHAEAFRF